MCYSQHVGGTQGASVAPEMQILIINIMTATRFCKLSQARGWDGVGTDNTTYLIHVEQKWNAQSRAQRLLREACFSL